MSTFIYLFIYLNVIYVFCVISSVIQVCVFICDLQV